GDVVAYLAHEPDAAVRGDVRIARPAPLPGHVPLLHLDRLALGDQAVRHADPEHGGEYQRGGCPHESSSMCRGEAGSAPAHHAPPRLPRAGGSSRPARPPGDPGLEWRSVLSYDTRARGNVEGAAKAEPPQDIGRRLRPPRCSGSRSTNRSQPGVGLTAPCLPFTNYVPWAPNLSAISAAVRWRDGFPSNSASRGRRSPGPNQFTVLNLVEVRVTLSHKLDQLIKNLLQRHGLPWVASQVGHEPWIVGIRIEQDDVESLELFVAPGWIIAAGKQPQLVVRVLK